MKTMFVWENISEGLTCNWHSGGGVLVIASSLDSAHELLKADGIKKKNEIFKTEPDFVTSVADQEDRIIIFPDAGCC